MSKRPLGADESEVEAISEMEAGEDSDVIPVPAEEEQPKTKRLEGRQLLAGFKFIHEGRTV